MKFKQHYSGSSGNFHEIVSDSGERLLIEAGVSWKKMLKALGNDLSGIVGCVISHAPHKDHCVSAGDVYDNGIPIYSSKESLQEMGVSGKEIKSNGWHYIGKFNVFPFDTEHDCDGSLGFVIEVDGESMLFATDTNYITPCFDESFDIIAIECNHDIGLVNSNMKGGKINKAYALRVLATHQSTTTCLDYIDNYCNLEKCREIHLLHMSSRNIDKERTVKVFQEQYDVDIVTV